MTLPILRDTTVYAPKVGAVGFSAAVAMLCGAIQSPLSVLTTWSSANLLDDLAVLVMLSFATLRLWHAQGAVILLTILWLLLCMAALLHTSVDGETAFFLFRQILMPAILIVCGLVLSEMEWKLVCRIAILIGLANAAYIVLEELGIHLLDASKLAANSGVWILNGIPGYYYGYALNGDVIVRAGGLVLNPPIAGIVTAVAAIIAWQTIRPGWRFPLTAALVLATMAASSRAGLLIAFAGLVLPWMVRRLGIIPATAIAAGGGFLFGLQILNHGGTASHLRGFLGGLSDAIAYPLGRGFGYAGNFADIGLVESSESLVGIAFSATGFTSVIIVAILGVVLLCRLMGDTSIWIAAIGLGAVASSFFSETAGAVNGTIPLWLAVGYALTVRIRSGCLEPVHTSRISTARRLGRAEGHQGY
ncbi:hypothetical protein [Cryobacterium sp. Y50]|uniref:hypothetical protein n=1 Tax=Cryobacterium sp. Y50 TaxID=2048286 RepID=UPI000CE342C8|nr:hypothetical protein [Cryobacterium sp. Y50]